MVEAHFSKGQIVEVRSDEEGFKGSWYSATIIRIPSESSASKWKNHALIEYQSLVDDEDGSKPLKEYADMSQLRPVPPKMIDWVVELNEMVDAFYNDGWWTGLVSRVLENSRYIVYFLSGEEMEFEQSDLRVHLEWINGKWVHPKEPQKQRQEISITSHSLGGTNSVDQEQLWQPGNTPQSSEMAIQLTSRGAADNDAKHKSTSCVANPSKNRTIDSTLNSDAELSQPCKKSKKWEEKEPPFSKISCVAMPSAGTSTVTVAQSDFTSPITKEEGINHVKPLLFDDQRSTKAIIPLQGNCAANQLKIPLNSSVERYKEDCHTPPSFGEQKHVEVDRIDPSTENGRSHDLECERSLNRLSVEGSPIGSSSESCKSNLPSKILEKNSEFVVSPETQLSQRQKHFRSRSGGQMKIISCSTDIKQCKVTQTGVLRKRGRPPKEKVTSAQAGDIRKRGRPPKKKEIEPQEKKVVGQTPRVLRRRGRAAKEKFTNTNASMNGSEFTGFRGSQSEQVCQYLKGEPLKLMRDERELNDPEMHKMMLNNIKGMPLVKKERLPKQMFTQGIAEKKEKLSSKRRPKLPTRGPKHKASRGEMADDVSPTEYISEVGVLVTRSNIEDDERPLAMYLKRGLHSLPAVNNKGYTPDDQLVSQSNEAITWVDTANQNLKVQMSFNLNESLEESTFIGNQCNEARGQQSEVVLYFKDNQCNEAREEQNEIVIESPVIDPTPNEMPVEIECLPFVKSSCMWKEIESMEVFINMPQKPHFRPLEQQNKEHREGMAIGYMVTFANLVAKIRKLQLDNTWSDFEDILKALLDLEMVGFNVEKARARLEDLLKIKDKQRMLEDKSKEITEKLIEWNLEKDKLNAEIDEIDERLQELHKTITQLNEKRASVVMKKINGPGITAFEKEINDIEESIQIGKLDFQSIAAGPW